MFDKCALSTVFYIRGFQSHSLIYRKKKTKKVKSVKKKRKKEKSKSKSRHRSKRDSSSSYSSSDSSSESESSKTDSSDSSEEWVEKNTKVGRDQSEYRKRDQRDGGLGEKRVHSGTLHKDGRVYKDTKPHRSKSRDESSPDNDRNKGDSWISPRVNREKGDGDKTTKSRHSSSSQSCRSFEREKEKQREEDRCKGSRDYVMLHVHQSSRKRKISERETYERVSGGVRDFKTIKSPRKADERAASSLNETFLESELKRIRAHSDKESEMTSAHYRASKTSSSHDSQIRNASDERNGTKQRRM